MDIPRSDAGVLASDVVDQRLHQRLNLRQFTERVELRELDHKLVGIEWIERALVFELHASATCKNVLVKSTPGSLDEDEEDEEDDGDEDEEPEAAGDEAAA